MVLVKDLVMVQVIGHEKIQVCHYQQYQVQHGVVYHLGTIKYTIISAIYGNF